MRRRLIKFLVKHNIMKGVFYEEPFIYVDELGKPTNSIGSKIKWLDKFYICCYRKEELKKALKIAENKYPLYKGYILFF